MAWAFHELGRSPAAEARLHEEVDAASTLDVATRLPYTDRVIAETLRLHSVWLIMRRALVPVELGGAWLPAGAELLYSLYSMHRNPALFPEPERFDPDRWSPDRMPPARHAFLPFGAGAHRCLGEHFGMVETRIAVATIARRWRLRPVPGHRVREVASAVVHPDDLPMRAEPRG
jgi:cytochrome P450